MPVPQRRLVSLRVESVHRIVLGGYVNHVVNALAGDVDVVGIKRLGIHRAVKVLLEQKFQLRHILNVECTFIREPARSFVVVVLSWVVKWRGTDRSEERRVGKE